MLSKAIFRKQLASSLNSAQILGTAPKRMSGGGPKKPSIPATQTDFDLVVVGKPLKTNIIRWNECSSLPQILVNRRCFIQNGHRD